MTVLVYKDAETLAMGEVQVCIAALPMHKMTVPPGPRSWSPGDLTWPEPRPLDQGIQGFADLTAGRGPRPKSSSNSKRSDPCP